MWSLVGLGALIVIGGIVVADAYRQSFHVYQDVKGIPDQLARARDSLSKGQVPTGQPDPLTAATTIAQTAQADIDNADFTFALVGRIPFLNRPVQAIRSGVEAANQEARAASMLKDMVVDVLGPQALTGKSAPADGGQAPIFHNGTVDVQLLQSLIPKLEQVVSHLQSGDAAIRAIPTIPFVHQIADLKTKALGESSQAVALATKTLSGVKLLPSFLGADRPKTYFLAMQNNTDQRATGGAVLGYGFVTIDHGKMRFDGGGSINAIDNPLGYPQATLPEALSWYLQHIPLQHSRIANSNWSPDFPTAARGWSSLLRAATGQQIDGVIALDPYAIAAMMGNQRMHIPFFSFPITKRNLVQVVENQQYTLPTSEQVEFPRILIQKAWPIVSNPHPFLATIKSFQTALAEKHLQIWSADEADQQLLARLKWDGAIHTNQGDYLYLTDNKLTANKVDYYTRLSANYRVNIAASGAITSRYQVQMTNQTPPNLPKNIAGSNRYGVNNAVLSLYVPGRAIPTEIPPGLPPHVEGPVKVFSRKVSVVPGSPLQLDFGYRVPRVIFPTSQGRVYQLTIQHQPMVHPVELTVTVTLPKGSVPKTAGPGWTVNENGATFHAVLSKDLVTQLVF